MWKCDSAKYDLCEILKLSESYSFDSVDHRLLVVYMWNGAQQVPTIA